MCLTLGKHSLKSLNLALLIAAEQERLIKRREVQSDNVPEFFFELRIIGQLESAGQVRLDVVGGPDSLNAGRRNTGDTRHAQHSLDGRNTHRLEILEVVKRWVAANPVARILSLLDEIDVPSAKVQRIDEVLADPQIKARCMVLVQEHPRYGTLRMPNLPFRFSDCDIAIGQVAPDLGEHNTQVATALGFSAAEIAEMQADGVLFTQGDAQ